MRYLALLGKADVNAKDNSGNSALHIVVDAGNLAVVRLFVEQCNVDLRATDNRGRSALHIAVQNSRVVVAHYLATHWHF